MRLLRVAREHRAASVAAVDRERRSETLSCIVLSPQLPNARVLLHMAAPEGASAFTKRGWTDVACGTAGSPEKRSNRV